MSHPTGWRWWQTSSGTTARTPFRHRLEYGVLRMSRGVLGIVPEWLALGVGGWAGWLTACVLRIRRADVDRNLETAFPERSVRWRQRVARRSYRHLGREAVIVLRMSKWTRRMFEDRIELRGCEPIFEAADQERGVVLLTAHMGNWELAGAGIAAHGVALDVVGKGMANRRFEADLFQTRTRLGMRVIHMSDAPRGVLRALSWGRLTALLADQNAHRHGVFVPFFGKMASTHRGAALFAIRSGAPVFVGFAIRQPGVRPRYVLEARPLRFEPTGSLDDDVVRFLATYHQMLEDAIRSAPEQYFWQHKRWKTRPPAEESTAERGTGPARPG